MSDDFAQANALLQVLEDLGEENLSRMHVAGCAVYCPVSWDRERLQVYADAVERLVFTRLQNVA